jgi:fatty-acyl-CoA synthase
MREIAPSDGKTMGELQIRGAWVINSYFKTNNQENLPPMVGLKRM